MTYVPLSSFRGVTPKSLYESLLARGHPPFEACALLINWLASDRIKTDPPLLAPREFRFAPDGSLVVQITAGLVDPAQVFLKYPSPLFEGPEPMPAFIDPAAGPVAANDDTRETSAAEPDVSNNYDLVAAVDKYVDEHNCTNEKAFRALFQKLGRNSWWALKEAYYKAHRKINDKSAAGGRGDLEEDVDAHKP
jgi:hypothetical protein